MTATATEQTTAAATITQATFRWDSQRWSAETMAMSADAMRRHLCRTFALWTEDAADLSTGGTFTTHGSGKGSDRRYTVVSHDGKSRLYRQCPDSYTIERHKRV